MGVLQAVGTWLGMNSKAVVAGVGPVRGSGRQGHGIPVIEACHRPSKDWGWEATWTNKRRVLSRDVMQSDSLQGDHGSRAGNVYRPKLGGLVGSHRR